MDLIQSTILFGNGEKQGYVATHDRKDTKVLAAVLFSGNVFCPRVMVKNGTKFVCVLMIPRVAQGLSVLQKH